MLKTRDELSQKNFKVRSLPFKIVGSKYRRRHIYKSELLKILSKSASLLQYREVFAGSASVAFEMMSSPGALPLIWLNDVDPGTANFWQIVKDQPDLLKEYIEMQPINVDWFLRFQKSLTSDNTIPYDNLYRIDYALKRMVIQKLSFGAYGLMGGRPAKNFEKRWSPANLCDAIDTYSNLMKKHSVRVTNLDFEHVIRDTEFPSIIYLDPVYYEKGNSLYQYGMNKDDHYRLSRLLFYSNNPWLLSYDDNPYIRKLYSWAHIKVIDFGAYTNRQQVPGQKELIITKKGFR